MTDEYKPVILLVDDCADSREIYATCLERSGFEVSEAGTGTAALESAFSRPPDLVVMDVGLPDVDGIEALHRLRLDQRTEDVPVIVLSGVEVGGESSRGVQWDAFLLKPCLPDELLLEIRRVLGRS